MRNQTNLTLLGVNKRALHQPSLWGDTYLTPQEAAVYLNQMLLTLKQAREKKHGSRT
jgi:hypothetical protein